MAAGGAEAAKSSEQPAPGGPPPPPKQPEPPAFPPPPPPEKGEPIAGWNGEHFFLQTPDSNFNLQPYGYVQFDYRAYWGNGAPPNTFLIRRARFGFQGRYDRYYEFRMLADFADTNSTLVRDFVLNVNYFAELQLTAGQFVEPFGQEVASTSVQFIDFVERGLTSLLYPSTPNFRSPGVMLHGDLAKGVFSYWAGVFNGKGNLAFNTTNEPEVLARIRIYPFKGGSRWLKGFAFGGAIGHQRNRGLSNELSFNALVGDRSFTLIPQIPVNGPAERWNGELTWIVGPGALRAEYDELRQLRRSLDVGFADLPQLRARAVNVDLTFLITGEPRPENGQPKPFSPFLTPQHEAGTGAIEVKARYSYLWARALGDPINGFPDIRNSVHEISFGINWYPSFLVRYMIDFNIYKINEVTAGGALPQWLPVLLQRIQFRM
jgi:phosphate-selective porin OprO/OprP